MLLKDAIAFLKGAVQRSMPGGVPSHYVFHENFAYARNAALLAAHPVPVGGTFALAAEDLESALARNKDQEPEIAGDDQGRMVLKFGRGRRSALDLLPAEPPEQTDAGEGINWEPVPDGLLKAMRAVSVFVPKRGDGAPWMYGVQLRPGAVRASSARATVHMEVPALTVLEPVGLSDDCVDYLVGIDPPAAWQQYRGCVLFTWDNGAWAKCQLQAYPWPDVQIDRMLNAGGTAPCELTADWRAAFDDCLALGEGDVDLGPAGMVAHSAHSEHTVDMETGVATDTRWSMEALRPMLSVAQHWGPDGDGPAAFAAPGIRGVVARKRR